VCTW
jgi:hypothetical protein